MRYLLLISLFSLTPVAMAQAVQNTTEISTPVQNTTSYSTVIGTAQDWQLTTDEWLRYLKLMQGQNGKWYPQLTPPAVLGLNAQSEAEKTHFAELVAKEEHDKLARELVFDSAVHQALLRLYADEPIIKPFDLSPFNPVQTNKSTETASLQGGDHLALFTDPRKSLDFLVVPLLIKIIQKHPGITLDVYCVGNGDDNAIRNWAKFYHMPAELVAQGRITLNHDNGQLQKTAGHVQLPYVVRVRNGLSQVVSPWSLA